MMHLLITGGAGFIGCNLSHALARLGHSVTIIDNLSRHGSERNLRRLLDDPDTGRAITFLKLDVRNPVACVDAITEVRASPIDTVVHLAAQVTVTESVVDPMEDFEVNARGTLNMLEAVRLHAPSAHFVFASTNKVYGDLRGARVERSETRYVMPDLPQGVPESYPADAASPYGCSKLAADTYTRDYSTTFGIDTTVLRLSCIYGNWQHGMAGQGWVSWLVRQAIAGAPVVIYGDGLQVRDLLHIDDLVDVLLRIIRSRQGVGETFNIGGGPDFSISVWREFGPLLEKILGRPVSATLDQWRAADQRVYITDVRKTSTMLRWAARKSPERGVAELANWISAEIGQPIAIGSR